ncbi:MAG: helix-turn-helix domain-containing protein [Deltaproteobacteria bacterium]|nr:helix-turn-helix domain-containing protein [Deltaproteobacteria bacterium]
MDSDEFHARVIARIRERSARRRLTTIQLADRAGVSRSHLFAILAGDSSPSLDFIHRLAEALGCDPHLLLKPYRKS